ncbi:DNA alkylation repair protein, partial [Tahibacter caeni]|uniref:DNA alkylation repair protein n=1 Tax=Tahibacter caeni TaxID=1453545 RepID=UPI0021475373
TSMATAARRARPSTAVPAASASTDVAARCTAAIAALTSRANAATREGMTRFAIPNDKALGVGMRDIQSLAKSLGRDHALAEALWRSDVYEARMLACYVADPARVDAAQMERWIAGIDNWAHCDTACFALFDRSPLAWEQIERWAQRPEEFVKRGAFALLASLSLHDRHSGDARFLRGLELVEAAAGDPRNFVRKAVNWALRGIGRRNAALHAAAVAVARRLAAATVATPRWIGKDALRELTSAAVVARLAAKAAAAKPKSTPTPKTATAAPTGTATKAVRKTPAGTPAPAAKTPARKPAANDVAAAKAPAKAATNKAAAKKPTARKPVTKRSGASMSARAAPATAAKRAKPATRR